MRLLWLWMCMLWSGSKFATRIIKALFKKLKTEIKPSHENSDFIWRGSVFQTVKIQEIKNYYMINWGWKTWQISKPYIKKNLSIQFFTKILSTPSKHCLISFSSVCSQNYTNTHTNSWETPITTSIMNRLAYQVCY